MPTTESTMVAGDRIFHSFGLIHYPTCFEGSYREQANILDVDLEEANTVPLTSLLLLLLLLLSPFPGVDWVTDLGLPQIMKPVYLQFFLQCTSSH